MLDNTEKQIINILFLSGEDITIDNLKKISNLTSDYNIDIPKIKLALNNIGLDIVYDGNKIHIATASDFFDILNKFINIEYDGELTPAALQVITIVAYMGQSSEADISFIRGIQSAQILRSLTTRGLLKKETNIYSLSSEALSILGLSDIKLLPEYEFLSIKIRDKLKDSLNG